MKSNEILNYLVQLLSRTGTLLQNLLLIFNDFIAIFSLFGVLRFAVHLIFSSCRLQDGVKDTIESLRHAGIKVL